MPQTLRQPIAQHVDLGCVPLFEKVQDPQFVVDFTANLIHVVASKIYVTLTQIFARTRHILYAHRQRPQRKPKPHNQSISNDGIGEQVYRIFTVKLRIDPIKLPSSYRDNFDSDASNTDINLLIKP